MSYKLPREKAEALSTFLKDHVPFAIAIESEVEPAKDMVMLNVTARSDVQAVIQGLADLLEGTTPREAQGKDAELLRAAARAEATKKP